MGYMRGGRILKVDLTTGRIDRLPTEDYQDKWLGGRGLNSRLIYELTGPETDPLGPDNALIFSTGPFTGTMVPGSGRVEIAAKSPASGLQGMSNMGGYWGPELKYAGYDSLILTGQAEKPVYLALENDRVEIRSADHLWGLDTYQTADTIRKELGDPEIEVVSIGPAGENLIAYASLHNRAGNAAGRTGMGTVMGSKRVKAVAVRGTKGVTIARPDEFLQSCLTALERQKPLLGMAQTVDAASNDPPTWALTLGNYEATEWEMQQFMPQGHKPYWEKHKNPQGEGVTGCFNCQVRCMTYYQMPQWGPLVASCNLYASTNWPMKLSDLDLWYRFASQSQRLGIDAMSAARMIAWAMDLYRQGKLTTADTDGLELNWGDGEVICALMDKIAAKEGFGAVLAENVDRAAEALGGVEPALNIKNVPAGGTNLMNFRLRSIGGAVNPRGSDEYRIRFGSFDNLGSGKDTGMTGMATPDAWEAKQANAIADRALAERQEAGKTPYINQFDYEARGELAALGARLCCVTDSLGQCKWNTIFLNIGLSIEFQAEALSLGTGQDYDIDRLVEIGRRIAGQERAYAIRNGLDRSMDTLPEKFFEQPMAGTWPDDVLDRGGLERMKTDYYRALGWDAETGVPTGETLTSLGLADVADDLARRGEETTGRSESRGA